MDWPALAISPDGRRFAYVAVHNGVRLLYVRQINEFHFRPLTGTEGAVNPFFRPDGEGLGFWSDGKLKRVAFSGGPVSEVCVQTMAGGGTWDRDGSIVFSTGWALMRVPERVGPPEELFNPKSGYDAIWFARLQPDGKTMLGTGYGGDSKLLFLPSGALQTIFTMGNTPYLTSTGHLVAAGAGVLLAAPFDAKTNRAGDFVKVLDDLRTTFLYGAQYALSDTGSLLYAAGGATDEGRLVRVDRKGNAQDLGVRHGIFHHVAMSPKEERVAVLMQAGGRLPVHVIDLRRPELLKPIVPEGTINSGPVWNPQGDKIAFGTDSGGMPKVLAQAIAGGTAETLVQNVSDMPSYWSPDGLIIMTARGSKPYQVLRMLKIGAGRQPNVFLDLGSDTHRGQLSPNMQWLLYISRTSSISQIYIRPWPATSSGEIQISTQGGSDPFWSRNGEEIFYRNQNQFMRVAVPDSLDSWYPKPELMFTGNYLNCDYTSWDIMPDGQHFIMIQSTHPDPPKTELHLIQNWFEELIRSVPIK